MNKVWILILVIVIVAAGGYFLMGNKSEQVTEEVVTQTETTEVDPSSAMTKTILLSEQNESSESGTAVLTEKDGKVVVTLNMTGAPATVSQPAHIHKGACPDVGAVAYPLTNVVNGVSETTLDVTLQQLASEQPLGINVHKSTPEVKVYVSCGDLNLSGSAPAASASTGSGKMKY